LGYENGLLRVDLAAPPIRNRANAELVRLLAKELGVGQTSVTLVKGLISRVKVVEIDVPPERFEAWLVARLGVSG